MFEQLEKLLRPNGRHVRITPAIEALIEGSDGGVWEFYEFLRNECTSDTMLIDRLLEQVRVTDCELAAA